MVAHRGGVTLGPYVGDTFALIEAPGASGARVMDGQGARVDRFGYALAPSLVPYHYNTVALNPEGMNDKAELEDGQRRVAPYAGATVRLHFNTVRGQALLITRSGPITHRSRWAPTSLTRQATAWAWSARPIRCICAAISVPGN